MKLKLKHLAGYLPYGLKVLDEKAETNENVFTLESISIHSTVSDNDGNTDILFTEIKPILRPLSDLTKEIEVNGEKFVPIERLNTDKDLDYDVDNVDYISLGFVIKDYNKLLEWHFDIYGLIENDLAIDIKTL
jgi:hypothetical protein